MLRSIVVYKTAKAVVQVGFAMVLLALIPFGLPEWLAEFTVWLRHHFIHGFSIRLVNLFAWSTAPHRLDVTVGALLVDGGLTALEAWALKREVWWGPWLVVAMIGLLLPFEVLQLLRHPHLTRLILLAGNLAIVAYLVLRARRARPPIQSVPAG